MTGNVREIKYEIVRYERIQDMDGRPISLVALKDVDNPETIRTVTVYGHYTWGEADHLLTLLKEQIRSEDRKERDQAFVENLIGEVFVV